MHLVPFSSDFMHISTTAAASCSNEGGHFYDDNTLAGIREKLYYYFRPIVNLLEKIEPDLYFYLNIDPSYEDSSSIIVLAEAKGSAVLPEFVIYSDAWKVWTPASDGCPMDAFLKLERTYGNMQKRISCVKCFLAQFSPCITKEQPCTKDAA